MPALEQHRAKRDFRRTAEPSGKAPRKKASAAGPGGIFVIHKHAATRLHYDLRLEHDGVLWSWAVTRGPSLDPHEKRLAVHVEANDFAREIVDFYTLGADTVWITFHHGRLFWTIADSEVIWVGEDEERGARKRRLLFPWRDTDLKGKVLIQQHLSSLITKVSAYRQTICEIANPD